MSDIYKINDRGEEMTAARTVAFTTGLELLRKYQVDLPADYPVLTLEDVDFEADAGEQHELAGMMGLFAIATLPERTEVDPADAARLEALGWFDGGTWQYRMVVYPKI